MITPIVKKLIIIHSTIFLIQYIFAPTCFNLLSLRSWYSEYFRPYQLFTHLFLHTNIFTLLSTTLTLLFIGSVIESALSSQHFITGYLIIGIGAAIIHSLIYYFEFKTIETMHDHYMQCPTPTEFAYYLKTISSKTYQEYLSFVHDFVQEAQNPYYIEKSKNIIQQLQHNRHYALIAVGPTAIMYGLITIFVMLFPNAELFFFFLPIKAKYFMLFIILELLLNIGRPHQFLHAGGIICAYFFLQWWKKKTPY